MLASELLRAVTAALTSPDEETAYARLPGTLHTSQSYALLSFADVEWTSEERSRYLAELNRDVTQAQDKVD